MGEGNGWPGLGGVHVDGAGVDPSDVDIGNDEGVELRLVGRLGDCKTDTARASRRKETSEEHFFLPVKCFNYTMAQIHGHSRVPTHQRQNFMVTRGSEPSMANAASRTPASATCLECVVCVFVCACVRACVHVGARACAHLEWLGGHCLTQAH